MPDKIDPDIITEIRGQYRLAKSAERMRIQIEHGLTSFARVHFTAWLPSLSKTARDKESARAKAAVHALLAGKPAPGLGEDDVLAAFVRRMAPAHQGVAAMEAGHEKAVEKLIEQLPVWQRIGHVKGLGPWGVGCIVGEAGDLSNYSGCRKLYKRLGLAPDDAYPKGEKSTGRMIPRLSRGRIIGIIGQSLFKHQWRGAKLHCPACNAVFAPKYKDGEIVNVWCKAAEVEMELKPAHAIGPYGEVYGRNKARFGTEYRIRFEAVPDSEGGGYVGTVPAFDAWVANGATLEQTLGVALAAIAEWQEMLTARGEDIPEPDGRSPAHADNLARRTMVKALLHDVWAAWHGRPLSYGGDGRHEGVESHGDDDPVTAVTSDEDRNRIVGNMEDMTALARHEVKGQVTEIPR